MQLKTWFGIENRSPKELVKEILRKVKENNSPAYAAAIAYWFFYAMFPFLIFLTALLPYLPVPNLLDLLLGALGRIFPKDALDMVEEQIRRLVSQRKGGLLSFGIILALWTSSSAVAAVMDGLNRVYGTKETRSFLRLRLTAILLVIGLSLFLVISVVLLIFGPKIGAAIAAKAGLGSVFTFAWNILRWPVIVIFVSIAVSIVYYFAPDVRQSWRWVTPGSLLVIILWLLASAAFSYYVNNFGSYDKTYGSLGAVIAMMTWLFISGFILLVGGAINVEIEKTALLSGVKKR
jgi:membrane protein